LCHPTTVFQSPSFCTKQPSHGLCKNPFVLEGELQKPHTSKLQDVQKTELIMADPGAPPLDGGFDTSTNVHHAATPTINFTSPTSPTSVDGEEAFPISPCNSSTDLVRCHIIFCSGVVQLAQDGSSGGLLFP
jgi:hypothetical protein